MSDPYYDTNKYLEAMQGGSKTGKWDIVVSYQCEKLSTLLGTLWKADSKTDVAKFRRSTLRENNDFELQLGTPRLSFQAGQHGTAKLLIPIHGKVTTSYKLKKGGVWVEDKNIEPDVVSLPENVYTLTVTAPLKSVTGSVSELSTTDEKSGPGKVQNLGTQNTSNIIIHFSHHGAAYSIDKPDASTTPASTTAPTGGTGAATTDAQASEAQASAATQLGESIEQIKAWFANTDNVDSMKYRLASVKPIQASTDTIGILKPTSFIFTTNGDTLCIYIQTLNSVGTSEPTLSLNGEVFRPMPKGSTASVIISHDLFRDYVFLPQLEKYRTDQKLSNDKKPKEIEHSKGFKFSFYVNGSHQVNNDSSLTLFQQTSYGGTQIVLDVEPTTLTIEDNEAKWSFEHNYSMNVHQDNTFGSTTDYTVTFNVTAAQTTDLAKVKDNSNLAIDISLKKEAWDTKKSSDARHNYMPDELRNTTFTFKDVNLVSPSLNFIAAESVLAPGATIADIKTVYTPYDIVLVGDLKEIVT